MIQKYLISLFQNLCRFGNYCTKYKKRHTLNLDCEQQYSTRSCPVQWRTGPSVCLRKKAFPCLTEPTYFIWFVATDALVLKLAAHLTNTTTGDDIGSIWSNDDNLTVRPLTSSMGPFCHAKLCTARLQQHL